MRKDASAILMLSFGLVWCGCVSHAALQARVDAKVAEAVDLRVETKFAETIKTRLDFAAMKDSVAEFTAKLAENVETKLAGFIKEFSASAKSAVDATAQAGRDLDQKISSINQSSVSTGLSGIDIALIAAVLVAGFIGYALMHRTNIFRKMKYGKSAEKLVVGESDSQPSDSPTPM